MKFHLGSALVAATVAFGVLGSSAVAPEAFAATGDARLRIAVAHSVAGKASAADIEVIRAAPGMAGALPGSFRAGRPTVTTALPPRGTRAASPAAPAGQAAAAVHNQRCLMIDYPLTATSYLGTVLYVWHHRFSWCTANTRPDDEDSRVISASPYARYDYLTAKSSMAQPAPQPAADMVDAPVGAPIAGYLSGMKSPYFSHLGRQIDLCVPQLGCYAANLPQSKLAIGKNDVHVEFASAY
ncbi:hypothetical protein [Streptomyces sp. NPDC047097]|uniref:hypothetical protein n=1 Tax=Streptomyces sp. NPDC047097 TaxID=3155260 RepID=UPI0033F3717F